MATMPDHKPLTLDERADISRGFSAGNFDSAYLGTSLVAALTDLDENGIDEDSDEPIRASEHYRNAYVLGFLSSYELHEMGADDREIFDGAYASTAGRECVAAGYCDSRDEDYRAEMENF